MTRTLTAADIMTPMPLSVQHDVPLDEAWTLMKKRRIRHLPVLDGTKLVGILSDRDVLLIESIDGFDLGQASVESAMTPKPYTVRPETAVADLSFVMAKKKYGSVCVTTEGVIVGIVTTVDLARTLAQVLGHPEAKKQ